MNVNKLTMDSLSDNLTEEELEQLQAVVQKTVEGVARLDSEGRYVRVNPAFARMVGFEPQEMLGQSWRLTVHTDDHQRVLDFYERMQREGSVEVEIKSVRKDGSIFYDKVFMAAIQDIDGKGEGVYCLTHDITERRNSERRLTAITEGLRAVVAAADELITCPDLDTTLRRAVELARENFRLERCAIFLEEGDTVSGTYGTDCFLKTRAEHTNTFVKTNLWKKRFQELPPSSPRWLLSEENHYDWDGERAVRIGRGWVAVTPLQPSEADARPIGVFVNDRAVTKGPPDEVQQEIVAVFCSMLGNIIQRKRTEEELVHSLEREREKSEQLKMAVREAHHRIKNNLQSVTDLLYLELSSKKSPSPRKALQASMDRIQAIALVHDLLSLDEDVRRVDMREVLERFIPRALSSNGLDADKVDLKVHVPSLLVCPKQATSLTLILNELVSNVAKHAFTHVERAGLAICLDRVEGGAELQVIDNGPGLPPDFDLSAHSHVGLEVAQILARQDLKGNIQFQNGPRGLAVKVYFPLKTHVTVQPSD